MKKNFMRNVLLFWLSYFEGLEGEPMLLELLDWEFETRADKELYIKSMGELFGVDNIGDILRDDSQTLNLDYFVSYLYEKGRENDAN